MPKKVVLAYSGGLDTSIIIPWLKENYDYDVIAMVGGCRPGMKAVVKKAYDTGASQVLVEDLRESLRSGVCFSRAKCRSGLRAQICSGHRWPVRSLPSIRWKSRCAKGRPPLLMDALVREMTRCVLRSKLQAWHGVDGHCSVA